MVQVWLGRVRGMWSWEAVGLALRVGSIWILHKPRGATEGFSCKVVMRSD